MLCVITHLILTTIWCSGYSYCLHFTLRLREFKCLIRYHNQPRRVKVQPGAGAGAVPQVQRTVRDADPALWLGGFPAWYPAGIHHCSGNGSKTPPWRSCKVRPAYSPVSIPSTFPSSSGPIHMVLLVSRLSVLHSAQGLCTSCPHCLECFYHLFSSLGTSSSVLSLTSLIGKSPITFSLGNTNLSFLVLTTILHLLDYLVGIGVPQFPQGTVNSECKNRSVLAHHGAQHSF